MIFTHPGVVTVSGKTAVGKTQVLMLAALSHTHIAGEKAVLLDFDNCGPALWSGRLNLPLEDFLEKFQCVNGTVQEAGPRFYDSLAITCRTIGGGVLFVNGVALVDFNAKKLAEKHNMLIVQEVPRK